MKPPDPQPHDPRHSRPAEPAPPLPERVPLSHAAPAWLFGGLIALLVAARVVAAWDLPLPLCGFKTLTGWPCGFCGTTRAAIAVARLDFVEAVRLNPLACVLGAAVVVSFAVWANDRWSGTGFGRLLAQRGARLPWLWIGAAAVSLNWLYVLWRAAGH